MKGGHMNYKTNDKDLLSDRKRNMLTGAILGDAYVLGAHWIYDVSRIKIAFGDYPELAEPLPDSFHKGRHRGDQTHYGDQTLMLHQFLKDRGGSYDGAAFRLFWQEKMQKYDGYRDSATRESLSLLSIGDRYGSRSDELGGAARMAPALYWAADPAIALASVLNQARLTHQDPQALLVTDLFARTALRLLAGDDKPLLAVIQEVRDEQADLLKKADPDDVLVQVQADIRFVDQALEKAIPFAGKTPKEIAGGLGQTCHARHALPVILAILASTEDYREAMRLNVLVGGDSATRAMLIGTLLGIRAREGDIPESWLAVWHARNLI